MYGNYETQSISQSGCDCQQKKDPCVKVDPCKKIDLRSNCGGNQYFAITNYFSELVHDWEKEAARYNLGIQELESIKYHTSTDPESGQVLNKVIFTYRKGHEQKVMEFDVAPRGEKGNKGDKGDNGLSAYQIAKGLGLASNMSEGQWIASLKGDTPKITEINVDYTASSKGYGECELISDDKYRLNLHLVPPVLDTSDLINDLVNSWSTHYYRKDETYSKTEVNALIANLEGKYDALIASLNSLGLQYNNETD